MIFFFKKKPSKKGIDWEFGAVMGERVLGQTQVLRRVVQSSRWMKRPAGHSRHRSLSCYLGHAAARWSRHARLQAPAADGAAAGGSKWRRAWIWEVQSRKI